MELIENTKIKFEPPKNKKDIVQCLRCQSYGHTRKYCLKTFNCVKCAGPHDNKDCSKPKDTPATCVLCKGAHPAHYKGCTVYRDLIKLKYKDNYRNDPNTSNVNGRTSLLMQNHQQNAISYSQAAAANVTTTQNGNNQDFINIMGNFLSEFWNMFNQLLNQNSRLITVISKLSE
jgi:hypothetical protein